MRCASSCWDDSYEALSAKTCESDHSESRQTYQAFRLFASVGFIVRKESIASGQETSVKGALLPSKFVKISLEGGRRGFSCLAQSENAFNIFCRVLAVEEDRERLHAVTSVLKDDLFKSALAAGRWPLPPIQTRKRRGEASRHCKLLKKLIHDLPDAED